MTTSLYHYRLVRDSDKNEEETETAKIVTTTSQLIVQNLWTQKQIVLWILADLFLAPMEARTSGHWAEHDQAIARLLTITYQWISVTEVHRFMFMARGFARLDLEVARVSSAKHLLRGFEFPLFAWSLIQPIYLGPQIWDWMIERFSRTIASSHTRFWPLTQALFLYLSIYLYVYIYISRSRLCGDCRKFREINTETSRELCQPAPGSQMTTTRKRVSSLVDSGNSLGEQIWLSRSWALLGPA